MVGSKEPAESIEHSEKLKVELGDVRSLLCDHVQVASRGMMLVPFSHVYAYGLSLAIFSVCVTAKVQDYSLMSEIHTAVRSEALRERYQIHESVLVSQSVSGVKAVGDERLTKYVREFGLGPLDHFVCIRVPNQFSLN